MEYTRAKLTHYGGYMAKAKGDHNSLFIFFITQTFFGGPLQFKLSKFHCRWINRWESMFVCPL